MSTPGHGWFSACSPNSATKAGPRPFHAGIAEPVRLDANDTGTRTGLGRAQVDRQYYAAENVQRRALETEVQAFEDEDRTRRREVAAAA